MTEYKGYRFDPHPGFSMYINKQRGSGPIPSALEGMFQTTGQACKAVDSYLSSLGGKGKSNGKKNSNTASK